MTNNSESLIRELKNFAVLRGSRYIDVTAAINIIRQHEDEIAVGGSNDVMAEIVELNFEPELPEITFQVPKGSRWVKGKYYISRVMEQQP